eukprot:gene10173-2593_t
MQRVFSQFSKTIGKQSINKFHTNQMFLLPSGRIKFFAQGKGYGFIVQDEGDDLFYHITDFETPTQEVNPDERVSYEVVEGRKGLMAKNIRFENENFEDEDFEEDENSTTSDSDAEERK